MFVPIWEIPRGATVSMEGLCVYIIPQMHCMLEISEIGFNLSSRFRADVSKKIFHIWWWRLHDCLWLIFWDSGFYPSRKSTTHRSNGSFPFPICQESNDKRGLCWNSFFHFSSQEIFSLRNCPSVLNLCLPKPVENKSTFHLKCAPRLLFCIKHVYFSTSPLHTALPQHSTFLLVSIHIWKASQLFWHNFPSIANEC